MVDEVSRVGVEWLLVQMAMTGIEAAGDDGTLS